MELSTNLGSFQVFAANINTSTSVITITFGSLYQSLEEPENIYRIFFKELTVVENFVSVKKPLPLNIIGNKIYYFRKLTSTTAKLFSSKSDAISNVNPVTWTSEDLANVSDYFAGFYAIKKYKAIRGYFSGKPDPADIYCCPKPKYTYRKTNLVNTATVSWKGIDFVCKPNWQGGGWIYGGQNKYLKLSMSAQATVGDYIYSAVVCLGHPADINNDPFFDQSLLIGELSFTKRPLSSSYPYYSDYNESYFLNATDIANIDYPLIFDLGGSSGGETPDPTKTVNVSGNWQMPNLLRVVMVDAFFPTGFIYDEDYIIPGPVPGHKLGDIDEILTYDPNTNSYISKVMTLASVTGRLIFGYGFFGDSGFEGSTYYSGDAGFTARISDDLQYAQQKFQGLLYPVEPVGEPTRCPFMDLSSLIYSLPKPYTWSIIGPSPGVMLNGLTLPEGIYNHGLQPGTIFIDSRQVYLPPPTGFLYGPIGHFRINPPRSNPHFIIKFASVKRAIKPSLQTPTNFINPEGLIEFDEGQNVYTRPEFFVCTSHPDSYYTSLPGGGIPAPTPTL